MKSSEPRKSSKPARQIAAVRNSSIVKIESSYTPLATSENITKQISGETSNSGLASSVEAKAKLSRIAEIRSKLDPETLAWSEKFPTPRNDREDEVLARLQLGYKFRGSSTMRSLVPENDIGWKKLDSSIDDYIEQCSLQLDPRNEMDMKNYLFWMSYKQRPETDIRSAVAKQLEIYFEDPSRYDRKDYMDLKTVIEVSDMFDQETQDIASEMVRVRGE